MLSASSWAYTSQQEIPLQTVSANKLNTIVYTNNREALSGRLNKELASEAAARRRAEERQERTERQLEQLQSMQQHSMMQRSVEQHGTLQHSMQQQTPDNKMSGVETEPAESQFQVKIAAHAVTVLPDAAYRCSTLMKQLHRICVPQAA